MELMFNGMGILKVEDGNYYIVDEKFEAYKKVTREDFIQDMNKYAYVCLTSWDKQDRQNYLDLVDYVERIV